jgi:uncharacterized protein YuzE
MQVRERAAELIALLPEMQTTKSAIAQTAEARVMMTGRRNRTISVRTMTRERRRLGALPIVPTPPDPSRPQTRGDCASGPRPCPWVSCKHHLYLDVTPNGSLKFNYPIKEPDELDESCALDVAQRGGVTFEEAGELVNVTREMVRQIEKKALVALRNSDLHEFRDWPGIDTGGVTHDDTASVERVRAPSTMTRLGTSEDVQIVENR